MEFIVKEFLKFIRDFNIKMNVSRKSTYYEIDMYDIPEDLELELDKLYYIKVDEEKNSKGKKVLKENSIKCCSKYVDDNKNKSIKIILTANTYSKKLNKIFPCIRNFFEKHKFSGINSFK